MPGCTTCIAPSRCDLKETEAGSNIVKAVPCYRTLNVLEHTTTEQGDEFCICGCSAYEQCSRLHCPHHS